MGACVGELGRRQRWGFSEWGWGPAAQQVPESENFVHTHLFLSFHTHILIVYIKINLIIYLQKRVQLA